MAERNCPVCGKRIKGRADKKYCNDYCRNVYNNQQKGGIHSIIRIVNAYLIRNRRILESLLGPTDITSKSTKEKMISLGFRFKYLTNTYTTRSGKTYYYCYDYGYLPLEDDWFLIVRQKKN